MKIKMLNLLMLILNDSHRNSLSAVLQLFHLVVQNEAVNKMSLDAVCTVMAPNLMTDRAAGHAGGHGNHQPNQRSPAMTRRMSYSSQSVNEVPEEMAAYLRRTTNSLAVCKLLINLHPLLFHVSHSSLDLYLMVFVLVIHFLLLFSLDTALYLPSSQEGVLLRIKKLKFSLHPPRAFFIICRFLNLFFCIAFTIFSLQFAKHFIVFIADFSTLSLSLLYFYLTFLYLTFELCVYFIFKTIVQCIYIKNLLEFVVFRF